MVLRQLFYTGELAPNWNGGAPVLARARRVGLCAYESWARPVEILVGAFLRHWHVRTAPVVPRRFGCTRHYYLLAHDADPGAGGQGLLVDPAVRPRSTRGAGRIRAFQFLLATRRSQDVKLLQRPRAAL